MRRTLMGLTGLALAVGACGSGNAQQTPQYAVATSGAGYRVGQAVEVEASNHWVPCTVESIDNVATNPLIRVDCPAYPTLSRSAGVYIVHDNREQIRPATGRTGPIAAAQAPARPTRTAGGGKLPLGEYGCVGSGGRMMIGLGFRLTGPNTYTDLDGARSGTYAISGTTIHFSGGHLDGVTGRDIDGKRFIVASKAECELWQ